MADIQPTPKQTPSTLSYVNSACVIALALFHAWQSIKPVPLVPVPDPISVVVPPKPVPPTPIDNGVKIVDKHGQTIVGPVTAGKQFSVVPDDGLTLTESVEQADDEDIDVESVTFAVDGKQRTKLLCTIRNGKTLSVIVSGGNKPAIVRVTCLTAPNPPPVDPVVNPVNPPPNPSPVIQAGVRVILLRDVTSAMSADQQSAFMSSQVAAILDAKCMKDSAGLPAWHRWSSDVDAPAAWSAAVKAIQAKMTAEKLDYPIAAVERGGEITLYKITTESALINTLNTLVFGGA